MTTENAKKVQFLQKVEEILVDKSKNNQYLDHGRYETLVNWVTLLKTGAEKKTPPDYNILKKYDVVQVSGVAKLICPLTEGDTTVKYYLETGD